MSPTGTTGTTARYYNRLLWEAKVLDDDLKGKVESETPNKMAMCCFHNVGYLMFGTENEALEALKELKNLKWLSMDDWKKEQWKFDLDSKIKRKLAEAKADLQAWEGGEGGDCIDDFDIALAKRDIATLERRERLWVPETLARAQALREALKEEWGWQEQTRVAIFRAVKDLEEGAIYAWDASRDYDFVYERERDLG
ncbi:hypothetical protein BGX38DRAFT_1267462 [Terfezia claveryi]|nr:hypothetical protein BGX38DRAFT_1267462 [Terfezia claveryi]